MSFLRRANTPTPREAFLVAALLAVGITAEDITAAQTANQPDFLKSLAEADSADLLAAQTEAATAKVKLASLTEVLAGAGFKPEEVATAEAFKAATEARLKPRVAAELVELSASRGIAPVVQSPAEAADAKKMTKSEFDKLTPTEKKRFAVNGGRLIE